MARLFRVACLLAMGALGAAPQAAAQSTPQVPPSRDYAATYRITGMGDATTEMKLAWNAALQRMRVAPDMAVPGMEGVAMIVDHAAGTMVVLQPAQRMAMDMPVGGMAGADMRMMLDPTKTRFQRTGSDRVLNLPCTIWQVTETSSGTTTGTVCLTAEGVMLRGAWLKDGQSAKLEATELALAPQPAAQFEVPTGYRRMQMPGAGSPPPRRP